MKFFLLFVMLAVCDATPQDLSGKMFTFPEQTNTAHVKLMTTQDTFTAVTVCLRSFTDLTRHHPLFSMALPSVDNAFLIFKSTTLNQIDLYLNNASPNPANFGGQQYTLNTWHKLCATWDNTTGLGQMWLDGRPTSRKLLRSAAIKGTPSILLGQEQDSFGGRFDATQSFVGMMSDVHMWDYVLSPCEIHRYMDDLNFTPGNVLNWRALEFEVVGEVVLEENQKGCNY